MKKYFLLLCALPLYFKTSYAHVVMPHRLFAENNRPDMPLNDFVSGQALGVITPNLATSYLLIIYRYLNNQPLSPNEQQEALAAFNQYFKSYPIENRSCLNPVDISKTDCDDSDLVIYAKDYKISSNDIQEEVNTIVKENQAYFDWRSARLRALNLDDTLPMPSDKNLSDKKQYQILNTHDLRLTVNQFYANLALKEDNIENITGSPGFSQMQMETKRLKAIREVLNHTENKSFFYRIYYKIKEFLGISNNTQTKILSIWIRAQQQLFKNTPQGDREARLLLSQISAEVPSLVKADIDYSIADSYLYENPKHASELFAKLSEDKTYPWHEWAKYLSFRALNILVNQAEQSNSLDNPALCDPNTNCKQVTFQAYNGMMELSKNSTNPDVKIAAADYANMIPMRTSWMKETAYNNLIQQNLSNLTRKNFYDMIFLSNTTDIKPTSEFNLWLEETKNLKQDTPHNEITTNNLICTNNTDGQCSRAFNNAYANWQKNPKNLAWLWLATYTIKYGDNKAKYDVISAVQDIDKNNPAFVPLRITLLYNLTSIKESELVDFIDETLEATNSCQFSAALLLLNYKSSIATSLNEFIKSSIFIPHGNLLLVNPQTKSTAKEYSPNYILDNTAQIINQLPMSIILEIGKMKDLPDNYRPVIYANLWVRSILLGDRIIEKEAGEMAMKLNPVLRPIIVEMNRTNNSDERDTLFFTALLRFPDLSPNIDLRLYRTWQILPNEIDKYSFAKPIVLENDEDPGQFPNWLWAKAESVSIVPKLPNFLTTPEVYQAKLQRARLNSLPGAGEYIDTPLIALANRHPKDQRYAGLLALYLNYTNSNSNYDKTVDAKNKNAYLTLKRLYPDTVWAKETISSQSQ